jgi:hypothetical protein
MRSKQLFFNQLFFNQHRTTGRSKILAVMIFISGLSPCISSSEIEPNASHLQTADMEQYWLSKSGRYRLSYQSQVNPIVINQIHNWILRLENAEGLTVSGADITLEGGMPEHDHGLPTKPRITESRDENYYLVEGMRFHMSGHWELEIKIIQGTNTDTALISLDL